MEIIVMEKERFELKVFLISTKPLKLVNHGVKNFNNFLKVEKHFWRKWIFDLQKSPSGRRAMADNFE